MSPPVAKGDRNVTVGTQTGSSAIVTQYRVFVSSVNFVTSLGGMRKPSASVAASSAGSIISTNAVTEIGTNIVATKIAQLALDVPVISVQFQDTDATVTFDNYSSSSLKLFAVRCIDNSTLLEQRLTGSNTTFVVGGLTAGVSYTFQGFVAYKATPADVLSSATVQKTIVVYTCTVTVETTSTTASVAVTVADATPETVNFYWASADGNALGQALAQTGAATTYYTITGLTAETNYQVRIVAYMADGGSCSSQTALSTTPSHDMGDECLFEFVAGSGFADGDTTWTDAALSRVATAASAPSTSTLHEIAGPVLVSEDTTTRFMIDMSAFADADTEVTGISLFCVARLRADVSTATLADFAGEEVVLCLRTSTTNYSLRVNGADIVAATRATSTFRPYVTWTLDGSAFGVADDFEALWVFSAAAEWMNDATVSSNEVFYADMFQITLLS